jgi:hypothetical protein
MGSSSVSDRVRRAEQAELARLDAAGRVLLALELGDEAIALYCATHGVSEPAARRAFSEDRHRGRRPSRCSAPEG